MSLETPILDGEEGFFVGNHSRGGCGMDESRVLAQKDKTKKNYRNISIRTVDGSTIRGKVNIGTKERVSDLFTKTVDPFIVISDAELSSGAGKVLFVNKNSVVWVEPED